MKENKEHLLDNLLSEQEIFEVCGAGVKKPGFGFEDHELKGPYPREPKDPPVTF